MNEAFENNENNSEIEKIKVTSAEIVVHGTSEKPYYEIRYYDISDGKYHIGYSSYDLSIVFGWLKDCFEIVQEVAEESEEYKNGWIPVSERLPEKGGSYIVCSENKKVYLAYYCKNSVVPHWSRGKIIAWQPLPEPYQPNGE